MRLKTAIRALETRHLKNYVEHYEAGLVGNPCSGNVCAVGCMTNPISTYGALWRPGWSRERPRHPALYAVEDYYMFAGWRSLGGRARKIHTLCRAELSRRERERNEGRHYLNLGPAVRATVAALLAVIAIG